MSETEAVRRSLRGSTAVKEALQLHLPDLIVPAPGFRPDVGIEPHASLKLIETDEFPVEFVSKLAERESWRKEVHRPVYHVHKWWANRLGSVFRGILLGCALPAGSDLESDFFRARSFAGQTVFDPFMGSGTTVGEAHKLGFSSLGRDINPVAVDAVRVALGPLDKGRLIEAFESLSRGVGEEIRSLYRSTDSAGNSCDVLYHFWVMRSGCPRCREPVDLFSSRIFARNAYPDRKPEVRILCPGCGGVFRGLRGERAAECPACRRRFDPEDGPAHGAKSHCHKCDLDFKIAESLGGARPEFRLYAKLVLRKDGSKEYLPATDRDREDCDACSDRLRFEIETGAISLPSLRLEDGHNTRQAMGYGFRSWRDFFNDRQLLALGLLRRAVSEIADGPSRDALLALFSGALEFNNMFASYKGEGTGAVRHMFSHHVLKPERTPIEANLWGTPKSSGSFSGLFRSRLLRAIEYREAPTETTEEGEKIVCSPPFAGVIEPEWLTSGELEFRSVRLSAGDSAATGLPDRSVDFVVTDPPFFDNVHYSELADFFRAWGSPNGGEGASTRSEREVQDASTERFSKKLQGVLRECRRVLKDDGLLVFTYHHSREEGWASLAQALFGSGFRVVNAHPVKSEMSVATPMSQAKEPIQIDAIFVCRKAESIGRKLTIEEGIEAARSKLRRLRESGLRLSKGDVRVALFSQALATAADAAEAEEALRRSSEWVEAFDDSRSAPTSTSLR